MLTYYLTDVFSIMLYENLNMTTFKCFGNVMCLQGWSVFMVHMVSVHGHTFFAPPPPHEL